MKRENVRRRPTVSAPRRRHQRPRERGGSERVSRLTLRGLLLPSTVASGPCPGAVLVRRAHLRGPLMLAARSPLSSLQSGCGSGLRRLEGPERLCGSEGPRVEGGGYPEKNQPDAEAELQRRPVARRACVGGGQHALGPRGGLRVLRVPARALGEVPEHAQPAPLRAHRGHAEGLRRQAQAVLAERRQGARPRPRLPVRPGSAGWAAPDPTRHRVLERGLALSYLSSQNNPGNPA